MVITDFQIEDKTSKPRFFQKIFLMIDIKFEVILEILILKINNANISFSEETLIWKTYTTNEILSITWWIQIVDLEEFIIAALDVGNKMFVMYVAI